MSLLVVLELIALRVAALVGERISIHSLGRKENSALATMIVAFGGAAVVMWLFAWHEDQVEWVGMTIWTGAIYACAFGLFTKALALGPVSSVSAWTNLTVVLLWLIQPTEGVAAIAGIGLFAAGAWLLMAKQMTRAVWLTITSDLLFVVARLLDAAHTDIPVFSYAASLYTSITLWMLVPAVATMQLPSIPRLIRRRPVISISAAITNAVAYITLFTLLRSLTPALVESISSLAGFVTTLAGVFIFHEAQGKKRIGAAFLMTVGVLLLLSSHDFS